MSTCPFNKVSGIGCPFYRDRGKGDYCACLQGDCPVEGPEEEVTVIDTTNTKPVVIQEARPIPSMSYSVEEFFNVSKEEQDDIGLEAALINRLWKIWEQLDTRSKEQIDRSYLYDIPWEVLCDAGIAIFEYLKTKTSYYDRD